MKDATLVLALFLVALSTVTAQYGTAPAPLDVTDGTYITSVAMSAEIDDGPSLRTKVSWTATITERTSGQREYSIGAASIAVTGDLPSMTAAEIFDIICARTIMNAVALGWATCPTTGSATAGVTLNSCVTRSGSGFTADGSGVSRRVYSYTCSTVALASVAGTFDCTGGEPTYAGVVIQ